MENNFEKAMSERTDEELIKILTVEREEYQEIAIEFAEKEFENRNIDKNKLQGIKEKTIIEKSEKDKIDSNVANSFSRFINYVIDIIAWYILAFIFAAVLGFFLPPTIFNTGFLVVIIVLGSFLTYFGIMEMKFQKTLGKFITKTKVIREDGENPEISDILTRTFCRLIPLEQFSFLFFKIGLHDRLSKTKVVYDKNE